MSSSIFLLFYLLIFLKQGPSLNLEIAVGATLVGQQISRVLLSQFLSAGWGLTAGSYKHTVPSIHTGVEDPSSDPHGAQQALQPLIQPLGPIQRHFLRDHGVFTTRSLLLLNLIFNSKVYLCELEDMV